MWGEYSGQHPCPICGKTMFEEYNSYDICRECGWEDDVPDIYDPDAMTGANPLEGVVYKKAYELGWRSDWLIESRRRWAREAEEAGLDEEAAAERRRSWNRWDWLLKTRTLEYCRMCFMPSIIPHRCVWKGLIIDPDDENCGKFLWEEEADEDYDEDEDYEEDEEDEEYDEADGDEEPEECDEADGEEEPEEYGEADGNDEDVENEEDDTEEQPGSDGFHSAAERHSRILEHLRLKRKDEGRKALLKRRL